MGAKLSPKIFDLCNFENPRKKLLLNLQTFEIVLSI